MKERGLRSRGSPSRVKTRVFQTNLSRGGARMERKYVEIDFHRGRSVVVVQVSASEERLSASRITTPPAALSAAVTAACDRPEVPSSSAARPAHGRPLHLIYTQHGATGRHRATSNGRRNTLTCAKRIQQHDVDGSADPLKVAARVRIPYGLPRTRRRVTLGPRLPGRSQGAPTTSVRSSWAPSARADS